MTFLFWQSARFCWSKTFTCRHPYTGCLHVKAFINSGIQNSDFACGLYRHPHPNLFPSLHHRRSNFWRQGRLCLLRHRNDEPACQGGFVFVFVCLCICVCIFVFVYLRLSAVYCKVVAIWCILVGIDPRGRGRLCGPRLAPHAQPHSVLTLVTALLLPFSFATLATVFSQIYIPV